MREKAREHIDTYKNFSSEHKADTPQPAPYDCKWRYFYKIGENIESRSDESNLPNIYPADYPQFKDVCETWGT